jgi:predicted acyl esterase
MAADAPSADVCARLCVVSADGCSENLLEGITRTYRADTEGTEPVRYAVDLGPVARRLEAGERDLNPHHRRVVVAAARLVRRNRYPGVLALLLPIEPEEAP